MSAFTHADAAQATTGIDAPMLQRLLAQLARLQGLALPPHRFDLGPTPGAGSWPDLAGLLCRAWLQAVPGGAAQALHGPPAPDDVPLLWLGDERSSACLVRGVRSGGRLLVEDADGAVREPAAGTGRFLRLRLPATATEPGADATRPPRARDLLRSALVARRGALAEAVLATLLVSLLTLAVSLYTMQVYDRVVPTQGHATLVVLTVGIVVSLCFELLVKLVRASLMDRVGKEIDAELSSYFFQRCMAIRLDARPPKVGTLAAQLRQLEFVRGFVTSATLIILAEAPFAALFIAMIAAIAGSVALVPLLALPLVLGVALAFWRPLRELAAAQGVSSNQSNGLLVEVIDGMEAVKASHADWSLARRWEALSEAVAVRELRMRRLSALSSSLGQFVQQLSYVGIIVVGVAAIGRGELTQGALIACTLLGGRALGALAQVPPVVAQWQHARAALDGLDALLALPLDEGDGERRLTPDGISGALRLEGAGFHYGADARSLQVDAWQVQPGERVAVIGRVGAGKSTLLRLLSGLYRPTQGRLLLDGIDAAHLSRAFLSEQVGYLPQDVRLFSGTLRDNLVLGLPAMSDTLILEAARATGLDRVIEAHPKGLSLDITEGGHGLSGGQRQLVGLTRLRLARPRVWLLDEPTAALDGDSEARAIRSIVEALRADDVLVIVTHKVSMLQFVSRIVLMDRGRIATDGPRDAVFEHMRGPTRPAKAGAAEPARTSATT